MTESNFLRRNLITFSEKYIMIKCEVTKIFTE